MAKTNKRFYWLKLSEDFFRQKEIKQLRKIAGGETFTIIYLKMLLKSLKDDGRLYYEGIDDNFVSELALDLDENEQNVGVTVEFLKRKRILVQNSDSEYVILTAHEMTGSEGESARRMRNLRRMEALTTSQSDALPSPSDSDVRNCDTEIENRDRYRERDRDREDITPPTVQKYAQDNLTFMSPTAMEELASFLEDIPEDMVRYAVDIACENNKRTWGYTKSILNRWIADGIRTVGEAKDAKEKFRAAREKKTEEPKAKTFGEWY